MSKNKAYKSLKYSIRQCGEEEIEIRNSFLTVILEDLFGFYLLVFLHELVSKCQIQRASIFL